MGHLSKRKREASYWRTIADKLWPLEATSSHKTGEKSGEVSDDGDDEDDLETQLAKELASIKQPQVATKRLQSIFIDTKCLVFMSCRAPLDPIQLTMAYFEEIERTSTSRTRNVLRLSPVSVTCISNPTEMVSLATKLFDSTFKSEPPIPVRYKVQMRIRNNNKLSSETLIPEIAKCVPKDQGHVVDLVNPEVVILVEIYQTFCGISVVRDWLKYKRFNVVEYSQSLNQAPKQEETVATIAEEAVRETPT